VKHKKVSQGVFVSDDIYEKLAAHLQALGMGYPPKDELREILIESFAPIEAEVALAIPTRVIPFQPVPASEIAAMLAMPKGDVETILATLAHRGMLFSGRTASGEVGYALQQFGYGFPQTYFWGGTARPLAKKMAGLVVRYGKREQMRNAYGATKTKALRYVPASAAFTPEEHAVFPFEMMEELIEKVHVIALAHCPCRVTAELMGKRRCSHPLEACIKYDDLAEYLIEHSLGREIDKKEALAVIRASEEAGLVHLVDNAREGIKHTCNCCGCCCWSVGSIRRRSIPRDVLMATYFLRETDTSRCTGCGACAEICPVNALTMEEGVPVIDKEWCIGCGVCAVPCNNQAVTLTRRSDAIPPKDFRTLHRQILKERGLS
jgi:ferredoxin